MYKRVQMFTFWREACYAGFKEYPLHNEETHRQHAQEALDESTAIGCAEVERAYGDRYNIMVLMQLPYFDCVRCYIYNYGSIQSF